jgi:hypothetical protein
MRKFNVRLAGYIDSGAVGQVVGEMRKPQSMRAISKKLNLSVYAIKKLF